MSGSPVTAEKYELVRILMQSLKVVDPLTFYHCCRVSEYSQLLAKAAGLSVFEQTQAEFVGLLHDIGKIGVPQVIIHKPAKLDNDEFAMMKKHPEMSDEVVRVLSEDAFFKDLLLPIRSHHERMDGRGYPDGLVGDQIPVVARVVLIADTYDAMTQTRSYRQGLPVEAVYAELQKYSGTQFDSRLVEVFIKNQSTWSKSTDLEAYDKIFKKTA